MNVNNPPVAVDGTTLINTSGTVSMATDQRVASHFATDSSDVSGSRAINTVYQNTGTTAREVSIEITPNGGTDNLEVRVGPADPPVRTKMKLRYAAIASLAGSFIVKPSHYYTIIVPAGAVVNEWREGPL